MRAVRALIGGMADGAGGAARLADYECRNAPPPLDGARAAVAAEARPPPWPAAWRGDAHDNRSAYRQPGLFSLGFCGKTWWAPDCHQQAAGAPGGWERCEAAAQCESWRWCVREASAPSASGDRFEECTAPSKALPNTRPRVIVP